MASSLSHSGTDTVRDITSISKPLEWMLCYARLGMDQRSHWEPQSGGGILHYGIWLIIQEVFSQLACLSTLWWTVLFRDRPFIATWIVSFGANVRQSRFFQ